MRQFRSALALVAIAAVAGAAHAQQNVNIKMQATWPASLTLYENFTYFVERVGKRERDVDLAVTGVIGGCLLVSLCAERRRVCSPARSLHPPLAVGPGERSKGRIFRRHQDQISCPLPPDHDTS